MDPPSPPVPPPVPVDFLSSLPEHLQDEILKRLDLRDAVRASALSRAWRRHWETLPGLALSFPDRTPPPSVVDRVLRRYAGPCVSRFSVHVYGDDDEGDVDDWLIALSRRSVESISIFNNRGRTFTVHPSIFSCDRLVSLSLERCFIPQLPQLGGGFAGFPVLKELYLTWVEFVGKGESQLQAMIHASPMLRVLFFEDGEVYPGDADADCVIEAPNLHTLGLVSDCDWRFGDLPRLQYASISVPACLLGGSAGFPEFLTGISQVQKLIFDIQLRHRQPKTVANWKFLNAQWTDGMCANLQVVEITSAEGWLPLSFMKLILSKASLLRTLSMDKCPVSQDDPLIELLNCTRASPQAQVQFKDQSEKINFFIA